MFDDSRLLLSQPSNSAFGNFLLHLMHGAHRCQQLSQQAFFGSFREDAVFWNSVKLTVGDAASLHSLHVHAVGFCFPKQSSQQASPRFDFAVGAFRKVMKRFRSRFSLHFMHLNCPLLGSQQSSQQALPKFVCDCGVLKNALK